MKNVCRMILLFVGVVSALCVTAGAAKYLVIDLSDAALTNECQISSLDAEPEGGWPNECKTSKLVMRRIEPGTFMMGHSDFWRNYPSNRVTLTRPFYIGVFEVTQKQWEFVMGSAPEGYGGYTRGDSLPVACVSYDMIRGKTKGSKWPDSRDVDGDSFIGRLREYTGLSFDLPTEAQWEYSCRAGTETDFSYGKRPNTAYMNSLSPRARPVGERKPNLWGLYDMHGNVSEWALDWFAKQVPSGKDPVGSSSGSYRVHRGGHRGQDYYGCSVAQRYLFDPGVMSPDTGLRLALVLDE